MSTDRTLFYVTTSLIVIGIIFSLSLSAYITTLYNQNPLHYFIREFIVGSFCIYLIWAISRLDPDKYLAIFGVSLFVISLFLMSIMHFLPDDIAIEVGGAKRWIRVSFLSLAPVEFFKVGFIYFLAWSFSRKIDHSKKSLKEEAIIFAPYVAVFAVVIYLIAIMQNDLGQVIVLSLSLIVMAFFAGTSARFFMLAIFGTIIIVIIAIVTSEHRILRIKLWWSSIQNLVLSILPDSLADKLRVQEYSDPSQVSNAFYAIKNGGFFGQGLGEGTIKLGFLTEVHTDFVLAGIAEEVGLFGLFIVISLFFVMFFRLLKIANRSENKIYFLFTLGVVLTLASSFFINAFGVTGITPVKGIAVPFVSYGGSSLLANSIAIGMVLMISKRMKQL